MIGRLVRSARISTNLSRQMSSKIVKTKDFPLAPRDETIREDYHGVSVEDPYRTLENADHETTVEFVHKINQYSKPVLEAAPNRAQISERINSLWDYRKVRSAGKQGEFVYYFVNDGKQNQDVYYETSLDRKTVPPRVFLDVNKMAEDGSLSIRSLKWSHGETDKILAYGLSKNGSDDETIYFKIQEGKTLKDQIRGVKHSSIAWIANKAILYSRYRSEDPETVGKCAKISTTELNHHTVFMHVLGTDQCDDTIVFQHENEKYHLHASVTWENDFVFYSISRGCDPTNMLLVEPIVDGKLTGKRIPIAGKFEYKISMPSVKDNKAFYLTNKDGANRFKVMTSKIGEAELTDLIPEYPDRIIQDFCMTSEGLLVETLKDLKTSLTLHDTVTGKEKLKIIDDEITCITNLKSRKTLNYFFLGQQTFTRPTSIFKMTIKEDGTVEKELFDQSGSGNSHNFDGDIQVSDHWAMNPDGTKVHYFVLENKRSAGSRNNNRPALVYGYGGFNIPLLPSYSITRAMFVKNFDGVYVLTNLRGGSELGEDWHTAGMLQNKENVFNDLVAVVNDVVERGYTKHSRVTIQGGSNGGLLVAATAQRAPQAVGAVLCHVGVLDMIRYPLFTVGAAWITEYGDPKKKEHFDYLMRYSPLHNLKRIDLATFPATLVLTADHDDRVVPGHSLKYLAELMYQAKKSENSKLLMGRIEEKAGHGAGKSTNQRIAEIVDIYSFLSTVFDLKWYE